MLFLTLLSFSLVGGQLLAGEQPEPEETVFGGVRTFSEQENNLLLYRFIQVTTKQKTPTSRDEPVLFSKWRKYLASSFPETGHYLTSLQYYYKVEVIAQELQDEKALLQEGASQRNQLQPYLTHLEQELVQLEKALELRWFLKDPVLIDLYNTRSLRLPKEEPPLGWWQRTSSINKRLIVIVAGVSVSAVMVTVGAYALNSAYESNNGGGGGGGGSSSSSLVIHDDNSDATDGKPDDKGDTDNDNRGEDFNNNGDSDLESDDDSSEGNLGNDSNSRSSDDELLPEKEPKPNHPASLSNTERRRSCSLGGKPTSNLPDNNVLPMIPPVVGSKQKTNGKNKKTENPSLSTSVEESSSTSQGKLETESEAGKPSSSREKNPNSSITKSKRAKKKKGDSSAKKKKKRKHTNKHRKKKKQKEKEKKEFLDKSQESTSLPSNSESDVTTETSDTSSLTSTQDNKSDDTIKSEGESNNRQTISASSPTKDSKNQNKLTKQKRKFSLTKSLKLSGIKSSKIKIRKPQSPRKNKNTKNKKKKDTSVSQSSEGTSVDTAKND